MLRRCAAFLFLILWLTGGCSNTSPEGSTRTEPGTEADRGGAADTAADVVSGEGMIVYVDLEGGFYGLVAEDGTRYNPINLADAFKQDSLRVRFRGMLREDVMTMQMWGQPLEVQEMAPVAADGH